MAQAVAEATDRRLADTGELVNIVRDSERSGGIC